jgi:hypothetical protein
MIYLTATMMFCGHFLISMYLSSQLSFVHDCSHRGTTVNVVASSVALDGWRDNTERHTLLTYSPLGGNSFTLSACFSRRNLLRSGDQLWMPAGMTARLYG